jgi:hypothetical protein
MLHQETRRWLAAAAALLPLGWTLLETALRLK